MDTMTYSSEVAKRIEAAVKNAGLSVQTVAQRTGIPRTTLDRRIHSAGGSPFSVTEVKQIADLLGVTAASLYPDAPTSDAEVAVA